MQYLFLTVLGFTVFLHREPTWETIPKEGVNGQTPLSKDKKDGIALIVAINKYSAGTGWPVINAQNDVLLIKYALLQQGFEAENIAVIQNEQATKSGILEAIETQLIAKAVKGGVAVFHFSGHGQQVMDDNGDELDGYDEAIVPYDSPMKFSAGEYEGKNLIRDEELGNMMTKLREKLGKTGNVMLILDSCHSGTGTRGYATARGTDNIMADSQYIKSNIARAFDNNSLEVPSSAELAPMVSFFGASPNQLNYEAISPEGKEVGSLSYAFSQTFAEATKETTYQTIFERIKIRMSSMVPNQTPQAEGELDQQILGGKILGKLNYFKPGPNDWMDSHRLSLSFGLLSNLFPGTKVGVYPDGTRDFSKATPIAKGVVKEADLLSCTIELDSNLNGQALENSRIFITEQQYGSLEVKLKINLEAGEVKTALQEALAEFPMVKLDDLHPDLLVESTAQGAPQIQLITNDEHQLFLSKRRATPSRIAQQLVQSILSYVQCKFLRTLEMKEDELDVRLAFVPLSDDGNALQVQPMTGNDLTHFKVGEKFKLVIENHGTTAAYYTVLDIQPDNMITVIVPNKCSDKVASEFHIQPGEQQVYDCTFMASPPLGTDILKLIATQEPLDLSAIESKRGLMEEEASPHPFEKLFAASYLYNKRGGGNLSLFPEISIFSKVFVIGE